MLWVFVLYAMAVTAVCLWLAARLLFTRYRLDDVASAMWLVQRSFFNTWLETEKLLATSNPSPNLRAELSLIKGTFISGNEGRTLTACQISETLCALKDIQRRCLIEIRLDAYARESIRSISEDLHSLRWTFGDLVDPEIAREAEDFIEDATRLIGNGLHQKAIDAVSMAAEKCKSERSRLTDLVLQPLVAAMRERQEPDSELLIDEY